MLNDDLAMNPIQHSTFNTQHSRRVAITGIGILSPFGRGKAAACDAVRHGRSGVRRIESIDASMLNCRMAGEVPSGSFVPEKFDRFTNLALVAAEEAVQQAALRAEDPHRFGVIIGTGMGGAETLDSSYRRIYAEGQTRTDSG
jgi:3-oxoacyl-(acyl-carrier-protein) synthase